jgi:ABC-type transport system substrate-binding protein
MTAAPHEPAYWLDPEKGELGEFSGNYLYDPAEAMKLIAAAGFEGQTPIELPWYIYPEEGEDGPEATLTFDSLNQSGNFVAQIHRSTSNAEFLQYKSAREMVGIADVETVSGEGDDIDFVIYRDYHSHEQNTGPTVYTDPRMDAIAEAQRREFDVEKRNEIIKDFQILAAQLMPVLPSHDKFTQYSFRWPWVHNLAYGVTGSPPTGRGLLGGHLLWLDEAMPNRNG